jgi:hypothetical protein
MRPAPTAIAIDHDDQYASHVGRIHDGRQFFLTTPFVAHVDTVLPGREFVALFIFDADGVLLDAQIDDLGPRATLDMEYAHQVFDARLHTLGAVEYRRIVIQPFAVERFGTTFGLIPHAPAQDGENWWVTIEPGDYMAFHEPWDSGRYDT